MATLWICTNPLTAEKHATQYNGRIGSSVVGDYEFFDHCRRPVHPDQIIEQGEYFAIPRLNGDPVTTAIIISVVTAALTYALMPKPEKPNGQGTQSSSPNNQASGQTNVARTGQGVPDVRGTVRSYPDLLQQAWYTYVGGRRFVREKFMISRGKLTVSDVRDNDTLIADINGANYADKEGIVLFGADFYPNRLTSLDDVSLLAPNNLSSPFQFVYLVRYTPPAGQSSITGNYVVLSSVTISSNGINYADILGLYEQENFSISGSGSPFDATYTIDKSRQIEISNVVYGPSLTVIKNAVLIPVVVSPDFTSTYSTTGGTVSAGDATGWTDWTLIKKEQQTGGTFPIYINLSFPQGLIKDNGDGRVVTVEIEARDSVTINAATILINEPPFLPVTTASFSVLGQTRSPYGVTLTEFEVNSPDGNACEIRIRRTDNDDSTSVSTTQIETIYQMISYEDGNIGQEYWVMDVDVKSDFTNRSQSSRKINCLAEEWQYPVPDVNNGNFVRVPNQAPYGLYYATFGNSIMSDAVLAFGENESQIKRRFSLDDIIDITEDIETRFGSGATAARRILGFNYTFDDIDISLSQRIYTACNPARVIAFRDGQQWRFSRKQMKKATAIFNRRNIAGGSELKQTAKFIKPFDNDSIDLKFIDPATDKEAHIYLKYNKSSILAAKFGDYGFATSGSDFVTFEVSELNIDYNNFSIIHKVDVQCEIYTMSTSNGSVKNTGTSAYLTYEGQSGGIHYYKAQFSSVSEAEDYYLNNFSSITVFVVSGTGFPSIEQKGLRPKEIDLVGCRDRFQARNRAEMELRELIYGRRTATVTTLGDGNQVNIGDRVKVANPFDSSFVDGEVLANEGTNLWRISERFEPEAGKIYYAHYTKSDGDVVGPLVVTATADPFVISAPLLSAYVADYENAQAGSLIVIGSEDDAYYYDWFVTGKKPNARGQVDLELATYDERIFEMD